MTAGRWLVVAAWLVAACGVNESEIESDSTQAVRASTGICHATGSSSNPYVFITGNGAGHAQHPGDYPYGDASCPSTFPLTTYAFGNGMFGAGGTITSSPDVGPLCAGCTVDVRAGTTLTLAASPFPGWTFDGWSGSCSGTGQCTVRMISPVSVVASFSSGPKTLTIHIPTGHGRVDRLTSPFPPFMFEPICAASTCTISFPAGSTVVLWGVADPGYLSDGFSGACSGPFNCFITLDTDKEVTATFSEIPPPPPMCTATLRAVGPGTIVDTYGGEWVDGTWVGAEEFQFVYPCDDLGGSTYDFVARPHADAVFVSWSGDCSGTDPACTLLTGGPDRTYTATFALAP